MGKSYGQIAYEAYFEKSGGKSLISGQSLPGWDDQAPAIQEAWEAAAQAIVQEFVPTGNA